jgi:cold shock CspA family protein
MAKSSETSSKKENEKKRKAKAKEKLERREERKATSNKGKNIDTIAYIDENGNLSDTPPDPKKMKVFKAEDMRIGGTRSDADDEPIAARTGTVTFFNDEKGYGFIKDQNGVSVFVHANALSAPISEGDKVTFTTENTPKGTSAVGVKKL